jgi:hypothetical protein
MYIPNCWSVDAQKSAVPASKEDLKVFLLSSLLLFPLSNIRTTGKRERTPTKNLTPLRVKGPICATPSTCATKANPHIIAVKKSKITEEALVFIFYVSIIFFDNILQR